MQSLQPYRQVTAPTGWHEKPREILQQIFGYLNKRDKLTCALVCREWSRNIDRKNYYLAKIDDWLVPLLLKEVLSRSLFQSLSKDSDFELKAHFGSLTSDEDVDLLPEIIGQYSCLQRLSLSISPTDRFNRIASIFTKMTALTELLLNYPSNEENPDFPLLPNMSQLQRLTVLTEESPLIMSPEFLLSVTNLQFLKLSWNPEDGVCDLPLFPSMPRLDTLALDGAMWFTDDFFNQMPSLAHFTLDGTAFFNPNCGLSALTQLKSFQSEWKDAAFDPIINALPPSVEELIVHLHEFNPEPANIQALTRLRTLTYTGDGEFMNESFLCSLLNTTSLRNLFLHDQPLAVSYIDLPAWSFLENLELSRVGFGDKIRTWLSGCQRLQSLSLRDCPPPVVIPAHEDEILDRLEGLKEVDLNDITPLFIPIIKNDRFKLLERLLKNKPSKSPVKLQYAYKNACRYALRRGKVEFVELLLRYNRFPLNCILGEDDDQIAQGETPLLFVLNLWSKPYNHKTFNDYAAIVTLLLENGANVMARTAEGKSVYDFARQIRDPELFKKLELAQVQLISRSMY